VVTCPPGAHSRAWHHGKEATGASVVPVWLAQSACQACPPRARGTNARATGRSLTLRFLPERHELLLSRAGAAADAGIPRGVAGALRRGRPVLPHHPPHRPAPSTLHRPPPDASAAPVHGPGDRDPPARALARGDPMCHNPHLAFRGSRCWVPSSPTASNSRSLGLWSAITAVNPLPRPSHHSHVSWHGFCFMGGAWTSRRTRLATTQSQSAAQRRITGQAETGIVFRNGW
jgi:hypothetical protein